MSVRRRSVPGPVQGGRSVGGRGMACVDTPAGGELVGEAAAAAVRRPAALEAGRGTGGGEAPVDRVDAEADHRGRPGPTPPRLGGGRTAAAHLPIRRRTSGRSPAGIPSSSGGGWTTTSSSFRSTSAQRSATTSLRRNAPWNRIPTIAPSRPRPRRSAVSGHSMARRILRGWVQVARTVSHSSARQPPSLSAGGGVGGRGAAEALEGLAGARPVGPIAGRRRGG